MSREPEKSQEIAVSPTPAETSRSSLAGPLRPFEEIERYFNRLMRRGWLSPFDWERTLLEELSERFHGHFPRIDVIDRDEDILVRAEVPGVDKKALEVSMADNVLTIKGMVGGEVTETKGEQVYRCEISRGAFSRSVVLPSGVDIGKANAALKEGVLEIVLPKAEGSRRKAIPVQ